MGRLREEFRRYADEGRLRVLIWFALAAYGIALIEWSLSPQMAPLWFPFRVPDAFFYITYLGLAFTWLCVVAAGFLKCGWPALVLLAGAKWGLLPLYMIGFIYWACMFRDQCI